MAMQITEIYADDANETHLRDVQVSVALQDFAPPSVPMGVSPETTLTTGVFLELPPGWDPLYHATPRRQLVVVIRSHLSVTTTDGATVDFLRGDAFLLNDKGSKGHLTQVRGEEPVTVLLVGIVD
jgi:hypothetical protein